MARYVRTLRRVMAIVVVLAAGAAFAGQAWYDYGRSEVSRSRPVNDGVWDGSWVFVSRDERFALFFRSAAAGPEIKVQYQSLANPEAFETDWSGRASYFLAGHNAVFEVKLTKRTANLLEGTWNWSVDFPDSGRSETGRFEIVRTNWGRSLEIRFDEWERQIRRGDRLQRIPATPVLGFVKASKRVVLWDELPF